MKNKKGFTLLELLVVVLIVGILSAIALPQYKMIVAKSRVTEAVVAMKSLSDAQEVCYMTQGTYTGELDKLDINISDISNYYLYSCYEDKFASCVARPKKDGYPVLEFVFLNHATKGGKHWCQTFDSDLLTTQGKARAVEICKTLGPLDTSMDATRYGPYYLIK